MEAELKNRDYFNRERQAGGRTVHDYGHTHIGEWEVKPSLPWWGYVLVGLFIAIVILIGLPEVGV